MEYSKREIREGRERMKRLLPKIRAKINLRDADVALQPQTMLGQSMMDHVTVASLEALVVYERQDGWHADIILRNVPPGVPNVLGTPSGAPCPDRETAMKAGAAILGPIVRTALENEIASRDTRGPDERVFELYGHTFKIPAEIIEAIAPALEEIRNSGEESVAGIHDRLDGRLFEIMGESGFDEKKWEGADENSRMTVIANMAMLLAAGVFRHPERKPASRIDDEDDPQP